MRQRMVRANAENLVLPPPDSDEFIFVPRRGCEIHSLNVGGFMFQVQRVNDGAIARRLPGASQSRDISVGAG